MEQRQAPRWLGPSKEERGGKCEWPVRKEESSKTVTILEYSVHRKTDTERELKPREHRKQKKVIRVMTKPS